MMLQLAKQIQSLYEQKVSYVLVTLYHIRGSAPQIVGAKMIVTVDGLNWGTVGGGKIEAHCIRHAQELVKTQASSEARSWNLQTEIGMSCGGEVGVFFDVHHENSWHISIFGAGHISQEICRILQTWQCRVSVFDTRAEWLEKLPSSENIDKHLSQDLASEVRRLPRRSFLLCMTMGHATDLPVLHAAFSTDECFELVGVIGSDIKAMKIKKELSVLGIPSEKLDRLDSPLGLPVGNNTPSEIAISICALLLARRDKRSFQVEGGHICKPGTSIFNTELCPVSSAKDQRL